jgi:hypothetical protein
VRWFIGIATVVFTCTPAVAAAAERRPVVYRPPVDGPVTDPFRPPATPYGSGNRGIDYATARGRVVRAAAAGEVVFAGPVGNSLHVVVLHDDGLRTSYSFLRTITVARGNHVVSGAGVGTSNTSLHFGARAGEAYIDPAVLLAGDTRVHLIPDGTAARAVRPESESAERAGLVRLVWGGVSSAGTKVGGGAARLAAASAEVAERTPGVGSRIAAARHVRDVLSDLRDLPNGARPQLPGERRIRSALAAAGRVVARRACTPADVAMPPPPPERHMVVLVGGLGSASGNASVLDVDTARLGYRPEDVMQFSYRGGTAAQRSYTPEDTLVDIRESGRRLRELLEQLQYDHPGLVVDVIAHSQGGLVARSALGNELDPFDPRSPRIGTLITLGTPHHGTDAATAAALLRYTRYGPAIRGAAGRVGRRRGIDPRATSIRQMAETSDYIRDLNRRPLPRSVRAVSIAARRDLVVPSPRSRLRGAENVVVNVPPGHNDHSVLPGSPNAHREIALALAGRPPTCQSAADLAADELSGQVIDAAERAATAAAVIASEGPR